VPWQVIAWNNRPDAGEPRIAVHEIFRDKDYPNAETLLKAVGAAEERMREEYPDPKFIVVSGSGPGPEHKEQFGSFLAYLLRDD